MKAIDFFVTNKDFSNWPKQQMRNVEKHEYHFINVANGELSL